jgi:hypothetical protein
MPLELVDLADEPEYLRGDGDGIGQDREHG